jgi:prophage regulatory protein
MLSMVPFGYFNVRLGHPSVIGIVLVNKQILRKPAVRQKTGLSNSTIWRLGKTGKFPQRVQLSSNSVGWYADEVDGWLAQRKRRP